MMSSFTCKKINLNLHSCVMSVHLFDIKDVNIFPANFIRVYGIKLVEKKI